MAEASVGNVFTTFEGTSASASGANMEGFFKKRFGKLETLIPSQTPLQAAIPFSSENRLGDEYVVTVELQAEHGFTYIAETDDIATLAGAVPGKTKQAKIRGSQTVLQTLIGYKAAFAGTGGEQSFANTYKNKIKNMWLSSHRRLEIDILLGQSPLGIVESYSATTAPKIKITPATWAPGLWAGMVGAEIEIWSASPDPWTAKKTSSSGTNSKFTITKVKLARGTDTDYTHRTLYLNAAPDSAVPTAGDYVILKGMRTDSTHPLTMMGLYAMATYSGTSLFNIDPTIYDQWAPIVLVVGSTDMSFPRLLDGLSEAYGKGGEGDYDVYVNPQVWTNMATDEAALRRYDFHYSKEKATVGFKALEYQGLGGMVHLKPHSMIAEGYSLGLQVDELMRIGATDITFKKPDYIPGSGEFFREVSDKTAWELRNYSDQAVFCECPGHMIIWTGQVVSGT